MRKYANKQVVPSPCRLPEIVRCTAFAGALWPRWTLTAVLASMGPGLAGCTSAKSEAGTIARTVTPPGSFAADEAPPPRGQSQEGVLVPVSMGDPFRIAAAVGTEAIRVGELNREVDGITRDQPHLLEPTPEASRALRSARRQALDQLIRFHLMAQEAKHLGLRSSPGAVERGLRAERGSASVVDFGDDLRHYGQKLSDLRGLVTEQVLVDQLVANWTGPVTVSEAECRAYYRDQPQNFRVPAMANASHIALEVKAGCTPVRRAAVHARAQALLRDCFRTGADFASLAHKYSEDGTRARGGTLGWFHPGEMVQPFGEAVFRPGTKPGQVLPYLVESNFGYHIIRVWEKKPARVLPYREERAKIHSFLLHNKRATLVADRQAALRRTAKIQQFTWS